MIIDSKPESPNNFKILPKKKANMSFIKVVHDADKIIGK
jgi:hypothetical protein